MMLVVGCGTAATPTPAPTPTPTFAQQRDKIVKFLRELNQASNNFEETLNAAGLDKLGASRDLLKVNAALTTLVTQIEGYIRQVNEAATPTDVQETAEIKAATLQSASKVLKLFQSLRTAIQTGNIAEVTRLVSQLSALESDPEVLRPATLQQALLAKYNIPDSEVSYRRPK
jgi:ABC-type transporter Mla subunit MlaD